METDVLMEKPNNEALKHTMIKIFKGCIMHDHMVNSLRDDWCRFKFPEGVKEKIVDDEYYKVWFTYKENSDPMSSECLYTVKYIERCREDIEQFLIEKEKFEPTLIEYLKN